MKKKKTIYIRKYLTFLMVTLLVVVLSVGCAKNSTYTQEDKKQISVVTTIFPPYDFARQVAKNKADISMLLPPGAESHSYEPSPQDIIKIQQCDIFIFTGGESDQWIEEVLKSIDTEKMTIIRMMDCVNKLEEEMNGSIVGHHEHGHEEEYDEHIWTSPNNAIAITHEITKALCKHDVNNAEFYDMNAESYIGDLNNLDEDFKAIVQEGSRRTIVFGDRFPFRYFAKQYGLDYLAAFPGCNSETEPSVETVTFLIDYIRKEKIPVVFYLESSNRRMAEMISESTGAVPLRFHSCHNLSANDIKEGRTYIDLMKENAENLREALK
ncbi:MAG: metal ABC transporter substrate-binding protein [Aminipila sp.]